jgi:hypothetical protein
MRLAHVLPLSVLLVATFWFPAPLHAQAALYAAPVPETRGTAAADELAPDVKLRLARLVEARDLYAVHSRTLLELRISPGSELRDSRIAAELCRAAEADAAAEVLDASGEMGLLLAALKQDLGVTTRTAR